MNITPTLAYAGTPDDLGREHYLWSPKLDGVRCVAHVDGGVVRLTNRAGRDITHRYPDIVTGLHDRFGYNEGYGPQDVVLDGELVAYDEKGLPSFTLIAQRDQASRPATIQAAARRIPATFAAFDVLGLDGEDLRSQPLAARLDALANVAADWRFPLQRVDHFTDGRVLWDVICAQGMEGVVGKDARSTYTGKRDRAWIKVKCLHRISCVVTAYEPGEGARSDTVGALLLSLFGPAGELVPVGKVGTGFNARSLAECKQLLDSGQPFIAEVECLSLGSGGQLRHPSFKGIRTDLSPADACVAQLDTLPRT